VRLASTRFVWVVLAGVLGAAIGGEPAFADTNLRKAYEKEFAHLEAQKRALEKRLEKLDERSASDVAEAERERDALQGKLTRLREEADRLKRKLDDVQKETSSTGDGDQMLRTTLEQAAASLEPYEVSIEVPEQKEDVQFGQLLPPLFEKASRAIRESRSLRVEEGKFFRPDGTKISGTLYHVGGIASYGISKEAAGPLAPAGKGRLKLWQKEGSETARALAEGEMPRTIGAFLYESRDESVEPPKEQTWVDTINSGGVIAWIIVAMSVVGLVLVLLRTGILALAGYRTRRTVRALRDLIEEGKAGRAAAACEQHSGPAARVLGTVLENLGRSREELEDVVSEAMLQESPRLERFSSAILVFAAVAPLLGLLGTVTGMISTFDVITKFGTGDPRMLSGGISEALVTTQLGLMAAIPLLLVGNLLKGWAESILTRLERGALRIINLVEVDGSEAPGDDRVEEGEVSRDGAVEGEADGISEYLGAV